MSRLIDPADEIRAFRELLAYDFFAYPPTTALLTKRLADCARFYERTQNLRVFLGELFGTSRFSAKCLQEHIWDAPRRITVIGSVDPWMRRVLESVPGCSMEFIRRADEVEATLQASVSPDALVVAPNELESGGMTLAHWADLRGVPIIGLSDTYRLQSVIGCRLAGFDDVLVCSTHPDIVRERIRSHVAWGVLRRKADERAAGYSKVSSKCH
jgi:hypothetical protein